jgi:hypothetical protein
MGDPPGEAVVVRAADGTRKVERADPVILVAVEMLTATDLDPDVIEPDGTLRLDTAGEYRYRFVRADSDRAHVYERIEQA